MQFHLDGFQTGDPDVKPAAGPLIDPSADTSEVDVLIVGCGPAGLVLAAQLAAFPDVTTMIVERKPGPLELGQADGLACRTVEMFDAFGLSERLLREAYWVNETAFWRPGPDGIVKTGWIQDVEEGLSEFPHVILNQARVHRLLLDVMERSPRRLTPRYGLEVQDLVVPDDLEERVEVTLSPVTGDGPPTRVRARYVVGCDGARSAVRRLIGRELVGDSANQLWGVIDLLAVTEFPDIRMKSVIQSEAGNIVIIPREGGYLARLYIELDELEPGERAADRAIGLESLIETARRILHPYALDVRDVAWWSVYEIGQRLADGFDDVPDAERGVRPPRVFIAGDACHTHSPKAGQGMNVSMQDAFNLGWKLAAVLRGEAQPALLDTYSGERRAVAQRLIDFDREWAAMHSARPTASDDGRGLPSLQQLYTEQGRFTAGVATRYEPSMITGAGARQDLARGFPVGERFHSAPVVRVSDGLRMHLGHVAEADGRWRLHLFSDPGSDGRLGPRALALLEALAAASSPVARYTPDGASTDAVLDLRAIAQEDHHDVAVGRLPALLRPAKGRFGLADEEKVFSPDLRHGEDVFDLRGVDRSGCLVVVRPDQYVADVLALDDHDGLGRLLDRVLIASGTRMPDLAAAGGSRS